MKNGTRALPAATGAELVGPVQRREMGAIGDRRTAGDGRYPRHLLGWRAWGRHFCSWASCRRPSICCPRLSNSHPAMPTAITISAVLCTMLVARDEAVVSYRRAVELNPCAAEAHSNLGRVLCDLGSSMRPSRACGPRFPSHPIPLSLTIISATLCAKLAVRRRRRPAIAGRSWLKARLPQAIINFSIVLWIWADGRRQNPAIDWRSKFTPGLGHGYNMPLADCSVV